MSSEDHHREAILETARSELDRAHRGVLAMDASEVRRGLELALAALSDATGAPTESAGKLSQALMDLDTGALAEMDTLIEEVRKLLV